jgi:hypothetical protein
MVDLRNMFSLTDFLRNHKEHVSRLRKSDGPEVLTVNGRPELIVQNAAGYQQLLDRLEYAESVAGLRRAHREVVDGKTLEYRESVAELRSRYGL